MYTNVPTTAALQEAPPAAKAVTERHWLHKATFFLPSFASRGIFFRLGISALLLALLLTLPLVKFDQTIPLVTAAMRYSPVEHAQGLYDGDKKVAALDFIDFYMAIPGLGANPELENLKKRIEQDRSQWSYKAGELWKGFKGEDSEEVYGKATEFLTEFTPVGDVRGLTTEGAKMVRGEEVDAFNTSLSAIGLGISVASLGPQGAALAPLKSFVSLLKKCSNVMTPTLKKGIVVAYEPLVQLVRKVDIKLDSRSVPLMKESGEKVVALIAKGSEPFKDFIKLAGQKPEAALLVVRYSDEVSALAKNARLATAMGDDAGKILAHGGRKSLQAAEALESAGKLSSTTLKKAMQFGESGLEWVRKLPLDALLFKLRAIRLTASGKAWYYVQWLISLIPLPLVLVLTGFAGLTLCKMWIPKCNFAKK